MKPLRIIRKIINHPLNQGKPVASIYRFLKWQLGIRIVRCPVVYEWVSGARFIVSKGETGLTGNIYTGLFEFPDMSYLLHVTREEDLFIDIGANVGCYTLLACRSVGSRGVAIEPLPETYSRMVDNIKLNHIEQRVRVYNVGLGEEAGELSFTTNLDTMNHALAPDEIAEGALKVPVVTLDSLLAGDSPTIIKIDVEGFERPVLNGAKEILDNPKLNSVIMELNGSGARYGYDEGEILRLMHDYGFSTYSYDPFRRELVSLEGKNMQEGNTIFIRDIDAVKERLASASKFKILGHEI